MKEGNNSVQNARIFDNLINVNKQVDESEQKGFLTSFLSVIVDRIFDRIERICIILWGTYLNEEDAAFLFRLPDPKESGKATIRNYALRSKKVSFAKAGRHGLLFNRKDLDQLYQGLRAESVRDF